MIFFLQISGCKIKALRAKTNTYIKTPVRGEEPVFVVSMIAYLPMFIVSTDPNISHVSEIAK